MAKLRVPNPNSITTNIDSNFSDFDLSYSDEIKNFIAKEMDIDMDILRGLTCAYFTNYIKISETFVYEKNSFQLSTVGGLRPFDNLLLILIDNFDLNERTPVLVHETGHYLSLNYFSVSIAEACALMYERKWFEKKGNINAFNEKYIGIESYSLSLKLLDMIKSSVFNNNEFNFQKNIARNSDNLFVHRINEYLLSKGCDMTAEQLFFLIDVLFYNRNNKELSRAFQKKPPYFYNIFNELHNFILPVLFKENVSNDQICNVNESLLKYKKIIDLSLKLLNDIKSSYSVDEYIFFKRLFQQILAQQFHNCDEKEYFNGKYTPKELEICINDCVINSFKKSFDLFIKYKKESDCNSKNIK